MNGIDSSRWLMRLPGPLRLYCLAYAGGSAASFRHWPPLLAQQVEPWAVELPGRGARWTEPPVSDLPALVASIGRQIAGQGDVPFVLFGHSLGGCWRSK
jgi:medium-chain acyl-[acyl-carrier-protein] hydrolase